MHLFCTEQFEPEFNWIGLTEPILLRLDDKRIPDSLRSKLQTAEGSIYGRVPAGTPLPETLRIGLRVAPETEEHFKQWQRWLWQRSGCMCYRCIFRRIIKQATLPPAPYNPSSMPTEENLRQARQEWDAARKADK